jgi:uncharacterized membrane protein YkvA (DUF1232 family)
MDWWPLVIAIGAGLVLLWLTLLGALWAASRGRDPVSLREALKLLPDVIRLLRRLAADPTLPRRVRITLACLLAYLLIPIDLVPDFIPVLGYADDAVIVAWALRAVVRAAGAEALTRHWPGSPSGLIVLRRLAGVPDPAP